MKRFLTLSLALFLLAFGACLAPTPKADAQYVGTFSQQTVAQTFTGTMAATATHLDIQNLGQAAHSIQANVSTDCIVTLDGSSDGSKWWVLAANSSASGQIAFSNGYFPHLRITVNYAGAAGCATAPYTVNYAGFQFPFTNTQSPETYQNGALSITTPAAVISAGTYRTFWEMAALTCTNTGAATAYVQLLDDLSSDPPTLGTSVVFQVGIPAGQTFEYTGPKVVGVSGLFVGAATSWNGSTAVGSTVGCSVQASPQVSFLSNQISSP